MAKVAVFGASGYSGEELIRLLLGHSRVELARVTSRQYAGRTVADIMPKFAGFPAARDLRFEDSDARRIASEGGLDAAFLALPHGLASEFAVPLLDAGIRVFDLSADFRLRDPEVYREFYGEVHPAPELLEKAVYGLPERHAEAIRGARLIACPGCYPTSVLLALCPLLQEGLLDLESLRVSSASGVSGAGRKADVSYLFAECNESFRAYGVPKHRHLSEIEQELSGAAGETVRISFVPHLGPWNRGIHTTIFATPKRGGKVVIEERVAAAYAAAYTDEPFVNVLAPDRLPDIKNVVGTNFVEIGWRFDGRTGALMLFCSEDNLTKGAAGQAVQCLNLVQGWPAGAGLIPGVV